MKAKYFVFGVVVGIVATLVALAVILTVVGTNPVSEGTTPPSAPAGDIVVSVSESYMNTLVTDIARSVAPVVQHVTVDIRPNGRMDMNIEARVIILGAETDVQVKLLGLIELDDGRLSFSVQRVNFAGIRIPWDLLPWSLRSAIEAMQASQNERMTKVLEISGFVPVSVTTDEATVSVALRAR